MSFLIALGEVAPFYNLFFVIIALFLFIKMFSVPRIKQVYLFPWKLIFFALLIYVVEEVLTILRMQDIINIPIHINGFFEIFMIIAFIYALLVLKDHIKKKH